MASGLLEISFDDWNNGAFVEEVIEEVEEVFAESDVLNDLWSEPGVLSVTEGGFVVIRDSFGNYEKYDPYLPENAFRTLRDIMGESLWSFYEDQGDDQ